ncbi:hypothetical protein MCAMS1_00860 [biofilm metagenome]
MSTYIPKNRPNHPILKVTQVIDNMISVIRSGDINAIELGCELVIEDKKIPFGKGLKSQILRALKNQVGFINPAYRQQISELAIKLLSLEYHPSETKYLCRLVKKIEPKYRNHILKTVQNDNKYNQRWLNYLGNFDKAE